MSGVCESQSFAGADGQADSQGDIISITPAGSRSSTPLSTASAPATANRQYKLPPQLLHTLLSYNTMDSQTTDTRPGDQQEPPCAAASSTAATAATNTTSQTRLRDDRWQDDYAIYAEVTETNRKIADLEADARGLEARRDNFAIRIRMVRDQIASYGALKLRLLDRLTEFEARAHLSESERQRLNLVAFGPGSAYLAGAFRDQFAVVQLARARQTARETNWWEEMGRLPVALREAWRASLGLGSWLQGPSIASVGNLSDYLRELAAGF